MSNRIFMNVSRVMEIADNLKIYSDIQSEEIEKYYSTVMKMTRDMEGKSKSSMEIAASHIKDEMKDAAGRMLGFSIIYKKTGNDRLIIDREAARAAKLWDSTNRHEKNNSYSRVNTGDDNNSDIGLESPYSSQESYESFKSDFMKDVKKMDMGLGGLIPQNVPNDWLVKLLQYYAEQNDLDEYIIEYHREHNVEPIGKVYEKGKYIENQLLWGAVRYGSSTMDNTGCGIIAIINAFHSMGKDLSDDEVAELIAEFEKNGCVWGAYFGTSPLAVVEYFENNTSYEVTYTTSTDSADIEAVANGCDTFIVTVYNDENDISKGLHFVNIEKRTDADGNVRYIVHNTGRYKNGTYVESEEYSSLEKAIRDVNGNQNSKSIMIIGLTKPMYTDAPENEEKIC